MYVSIGSVDACVTSLLSGLWTKIENGIQVLKGSSVTLSSLAAELKLEGKKQNSKKQKKTISDEQVEVEDALYTIKVSIMKYKKLWSMLDCRKLVEQDHNDITDYLIEISDIVISLCDDQRYFGELEKICGFIAVDSIYIFQSILAWATNEIYLKSKEMKSFDDNNKGNNENENESYQNNKMIRNATNQDENEKDNENGNENENENEKYRKEVDLELSDSTDIVLNLREKLLDELLTWMALGEDSQEREYKDVREFHRTLQREAFSLIGTLRALFPIKCGLYQYVDKLSFLPSQDLLGGLRKVFETEGERIKEDLKRCEDIILLHDESNHNSNSNRNTSINRDAGINASITGNNKIKAIQDTENLTNMLVNSLLLPLSNSIMYDIGNLNRRQAAAMLFYYLHPSTIVQESVKNLIKFLKEGDIVKYLEVQMVALKSFYTEKVVNKIKIKASLEEDSGLEDYLEAERYASEVIYFCILFVLFFLS